MLTRYLILLIMGVSLLGCHISPKHDQNLPQKPYKEWRIGGRYPTYFPAKVFQVSMKTQSNQWQRIRIAIGDNQNKVITKWSIPNGMPDALDVYSDLPEDLYICWVSFVDQTFYRTHITVPLAIRQQMTVKDSFTIEYDPPHPSKVFERYWDTLIFGFAPGGHVTAWLTGIPNKETIEFGTFTSENVGVDSISCPNPYQHGKIPEISDKAKAWLKQHGMPKYWQEPASSTSPQRINHATR